LSDKTPVADVLLHRFAQWGDNVALGTGTSESTYADLLNLVEEFAHRFDKAGVLPGDRVAIVGDHGPASTAALIELIRRKAVAVPLTSRTRAGRGGLLETLSFSQFLVDCVSKDSVVTVLNRGPDGAPPLLAELRSSGLPGLLLFTSGTSGEPKVVVHNFDRLLEPFRSSAPPLRTVSVLLFDHWGGLNTLLRVLSSGGFLACPPTRRPDDICALVDHYSLELLPASPSFLNMMLLSGSHTRHDMSSLRTISYGAEPMPETVLARLSRSFPGVRLQQTYGLVELGVMKTRSASSDSLLMQIGGEGYEYRVVDGLLEIKAESSMLGYLNAPSPFTDDGFFRTGDRVEVQGSLVRVLGRASEMINVGGEKVMPTEVESVILKCEVVADAVVYGQPHALLGQIVAADIVPRNGNVEDAIRIRRQVRNHALEHLPAHQVPMKIRVVKGPLSNDRLKRVRPVGPQNV
jgi:long-chain acyl-CoA synthetase